MGVMRTARWLAVPVFGALVLVAGARVGPNVPLPPIAAYALAFVCVCGLVLASAWACPAWTRRERLHAIAPLLVALIGLGHVALAAQVTALHAAIVLASLLVIGSALGSTVGRAVEQVGHLVFVVLVSSLADAVSVLHPSGPSNAIVQSEQALSLLALPFPLLGTPSTPPLLGVGDAVFAALYLASARRHALPLGRTLVALALGFAATMGCVLATELPVPALPFLGVAMLLAHPEARRPPARDRLRGFAVIGLLAAVLLGMWWTA